MSATFEDTWRRARLEMPAVPALLVRSWAQEAYTKLCDLNGWAFLRAEGSLNIQASRSFSATVTLGSNQVTSAALFVPGDVGRQFRVTRLPIYTITAVSLDLSTATLDQPYARETDVGTQTVQVFDAYATLPADFRRFLIIYDRYFLRTIPFWLSEDELGVADPGRVSSDQGPRYLIAQKYDPSPATFGQVRYEYWPSPTAARDFPFLYIRKADQLTDGTVLPGVLSERADVLKTYCLSRGAMWPGSTDAKNPFFSPPVAQLLRQEWESEVQRLVLVDDSEYPQQLMTIHWARRMGAIAPTATLLRQTDATINDYY